MIVAPIVPAATAIAGVMVEALVWRGPPQAHHAVRPAHGPPQRAVPCGRRTGLTGGVSREPDRLARLDDGPMINPL
jgi:hypothetical protein